MRIAIVVAATDDGVIGKDNAIPWRLPDDLKWFKQVTMGKPIVMGRKTYDSIGRPLSGRTNIVISRQGNLTIPGCTVVASLGDAFKFVADAPEVAVIGGAEFFRQALPIADTIYLTRVHAKIDGDVSLPTFSDSEWRETNREAHAADERHAHAFSFLTLSRIR